MLSAGEIMLVGVGGSGETALDKPLGLVGVREPRLEVGVREARRQPTIALPVVDVGKILSVGTGSKARFVRAHAKSTKNRILCVDVSSSFAR